MLALAFAAALVGSGCASHARAANKTSSAPKPAPVFAEAVRMGDVSQTVSVTGSLAALQDVSLSAKQGGRLAAVSVREGDRVFAGQILARVDAVDLITQEQEDEAGVFSDQAKLQQAQASYIQQVQDTQASIGSARAAYNEQVATSRAQVLSDQSALSSARSALATELEGARPEERLETEATLASGQANFNKAQADLNRYAKLHNAGAVSDADYDSYVNTRDVAQATLNSDKAALTLQQKGNRPEDVEQAREKVRQAEDTLRQGIAGQSEDAVKKASLETALADQSQNEVMLADVQVARADLQQARNTLTIARQAVADTVVLAPFAGRVSSRSAEPGQVVTSATVLLHVIALDSVFFEPSVPDEAIHDIRIGQPVTVQIDAYPGRSFQGRVTRIYPQGSSDSRTVPLRIELPNTNGMLRPNMYAEGSITTATRRHVVLIPQAAVVHLSQDHVFTVENGVARDHVVTLGLSTDEGEWLEAKGLSPQARVIVLGQSGLHDGQKIVVADDQTAQS